MLVSILLSSIFLDALEGQQRFGGLGPAQSQWWEMKEASLCDIAISLLKSSPPLEEYKNISLENYLVKTSKNDWKKMCMCDFWFLFQLLFFF